MPQLYFDWNATAPPLPAVIDAMHAAALEAWGNPASVHAHGRAARRLVEEGRAAVAALGGVDPRDVLLTSGGTEANNIAIRSAFAGAGARRVLVTSRLEHPSVTRVAEALEREGRAELRWLAVLPDGRVDLADLEGALATGNVALVAIQSVNAETGVIQPVAEAAALARKHGARIHVDAVQEWGKVDLRYDADTASFAAHKLRGPKGIGALIARPGLQLTPVLVGGSQERGLRPGTVDPVASAGLAVAAQHAKDGGPARYARLATRRDALESALLARAEGARVNGTSERAPHVTNIAFARWSGPELVAALDLEGLSCSSGSACTAGTAEPSVALRAMVGAARAASSVRLSMGETTTEDDVALAVETFARVLRRAG